MTIVTVFNMMESVWFMFENKPVSAAISRVNIVKSMSNVVDITYESYLVGTGKTASVKEANIFKTKEELLASL